MCWCIVYYTVFLVYYTVFLLYTVLYSLYYTAYHTAYYVSVMVGEGALPVHYALWLAEVGCANVASANVETVFSGRGPHQRQVSHAQRGAAERLRLPPLQLQVRLAPVDARRDRCGVQEAVWQAAARVGC